MTTDFRALCAELADDLEPWITYGEIEAIEKSHDLIDRARAALAAEPAPFSPDGEMAELVEVLRHCSDGAGACGDEGAAWVTARAADLLERLASPVCVVLKPSPELIEAFKAVGPGRVEPMERLALQPVPEGASDAELLKVAATVIAPYESCGISVGEYEAETESAVEVYGSELIAFARDVLARWGHAPNA